jgi:hypothetical protein
VSSSPHHLGQVQRRVAEGDYQVNPTQVAEAILRRNGAITLDREISDPEPDDHARAEPLRRRSEV